MEKFDYAILKNSNVIQEKRLPVHSNHVCMPNWFEAEQNSFRMSLDGLWKFAYAKNMDLAVVDFEKEEYNCKGWDEIRVPSSLEVEGHFLSEITEEYNPVASYVKYFTLPVNMRGERVCISFQGVEGGLAVWLNGQYVGYNEEPFAPAEFELTPYLKAGENKLAVRVWKWTSSSVTEEECLRFWGIFRGVYLYAVPRTHIWDLQIVPEVSEDLSEASLTILTTTCGKGEIEVQLFDDTMQEVLGGVMAIEEGEEGSDDIQSGIAGMIMDPKLWSAETPILYTLQLEVRDENGDLTEVTSQSVGFCRFEMKDDVMHLNGKPVVFKGVNWLGLSADRSRVLTREEMRDAVVTMKQNNINTVWASRFLDSSYMNELCDAYGLYVMKEDENYDNALQYMEWTKSAFSTKLQEIKYNCQNITVTFDEKTFTVWNQNLFRNTNVYQAFVLLQKDGQAIAKFEMEISVAPLEKKKYDIPQQFLDIMDNLKIASIVSGGETPEFAVTVSFCLKENNMWAKRGHEVAFGQYIYKKEVLPYECEEPIEVVQGRNAIVVKGCHFSALFSKEDEGLISYVYGGKEMLKSAPLPNFWRVPMEKDAERLTQQNYVQWKLASMYLTVKNQENTPLIEELENSVKVIYNYYMPTTPASGCQVCYHVFGDGTIETTMICDSVEELGEMPEFGMMFKLDLEYDRVRWYGLGPEATDTEDQKGGKLGIYENKVADILTGNCVSQEYENICGVRFAEVMNHAECGMCFFGDAMSFSALPYTPHELENAANDSKLPEVQNTVIRVALSDVSKKKVFTFCFRGV
ncbi:MAG: DUF4981 domain-containing protein [Agathobacter sp.]|nr:DUF4981 domain-containing protein [Agathobacter sp.]